MITLTIQLLTFLSDVDIKLIDKIKFLPLLILSLLLPNYNNSMKKTYCLDSQAFYYLGRHKNIMLDHLISHLNVYKKYYRNADVVVDVGASFGTFPRILSYFNPAARIYCIEMAKPSFDILKLNTGSLGNTKCFQYALGDRKQQAKFFYNQQYPEGSYLNSREKTNSTISMITLDDFTSQNRLSKISLLKIDTEGFELKILRGAKNTLANTENLVVEVDFSNSNLVQIQKLLYSLGFKLVNIGEINFDTKNNMINSCDFVFRKIAFK